MVIFDRGYCKFTQPACLWDSSCGVGSIANHSCELNVTLLMWNAQNEVRQHKYRAKLTYNLQINVELELTHNRILRRTMFHTELNHSTGKKRNIFWHSRVSDDK